MDLSKPISSVIPSAHGAVLGVLARTQRPLTGRTVAELTGGQVGRTRANEVLAELTRAGVVRCEEHPPAKLYVLNRSHVAAEAVVALAQLRDRLLDRMRARLEEWSPPPLGAWLFGSFARGEGDARSDIDVLVIRPDAVADDDARWTTQLDAFSADVSAWSGNRCSVIDYSAAEFRRMVDAGERIAVDVRGDGILLFGTDGVRGARSRRRP